MDEHAENYRFELPHLKERPSVYFRRQCFVSFELEERAVSYVAETVGTQTLVFASDFPHHDCFFPGAVEKIHRRRISMAPFSDARIIRTGYISIRLTTNYCAACRWI
jgi:predicted TIM-barrel fold metal-dependent hydrolase